MNQNFVLFDENEGPVAQPAVYTTSSENLLESRVLSSSSNVNTSPSVGVPLPIWSTSKPFRIFTIRNPDCFLFQDTSNEDKQILMIERKESGAGKFSYLSLSEMKTMMMKGFVNYVDIYAVIGIIRIQTGAFLVAITERKKVGKIDKSEVFCIAEAAFLPFSNRIIDIMDPLEKQNIEKSHVEIRKWLASNSFFYSHDYNITCRASHNTTAQHASSTNGSIWASADIRFFWNRHILHYFIKNRLNDWIIPVMKGYVETRTVGIGGHVVDIILISRLSCLRVGTRFNIRGVNDDGHVANYVETEQIVMCEGKLASFVQARGSVPVFWEQKMVRGKHRTATSRGKEATAPAFKKHIESMTKHYGKLYIVNLLSPLISDEKTIVDAFEEQIKMANNPDVFYKSFDMHEQLGKNGNKFHLIGPLLLDNLQTELLRFGLYARDKDGQELLNQKGIFRTNCLDCLDRTNMCQAAIGQRAFCLGLQMLGVIPIFADDDSYQAMSVLTACGGAELITEMWANNGDVLSIEYTGTGALKSKLMRTGKLTWTGIAEDAFRSVKRTYQNTFLDNEKQQIIDYFLGNQSGAEEAEEETDLLAMQLRARQNDFLESDQIKIFVGTWNVGGKNPGEKLDPWIGAVDNSTQPDVYVVGFQEIVALTGKSVWNADETNAQMFQKDILEYICKGGRKYVLLRYYQLVGIMISVFVREDQIDFFREVHSERAKVGFKGIAGNKGAISIRFNYHQTSFCFTIAHLAAGQGNVEERNRDYDDIISSTSFRLSKGRVGILDHDYVFFFGDLNYRITLDYAEVRKNINLQSWDNLLVYDQLSNQMKQGLVLSGFKEGPIKFQPTYKFDQGTDVYDTSEKRRTPAWCDRILYKGNQLQQLSYTSAPLLTSDHKPVCSVFIAVVKKINAAKQQEVLSELSSSIENISKEQSTKANVLIDLLDSSNSDHNPTPSAIPFNPFDDAAPSNGANDQPFNPFMSAPVPRHVSEEEHNKSPVASQPLPRKAPLPPKNVDEIAKPLPPLPQEIKSQDTNPPALPPKPLELPPKPQLAQQQPPLPLKPQQLQQPLLPQQLQQPLPQQSFQPPLHQQPLQPHQPLQPQPLQQPLVPQQLQQPPQQPALPPKQNNPFNPFIDTSTPQNQPTAVPAFNPFADLVPKELSHKQPTSPTQQFNQTLQPFQQPTPQPISFAQFPATMTPFSAPPPAVNTPPAVLFPSNFQPSPPSNNMNNANNANNTNNQLVFDPFATFTPTSTPSASSSSIPALQPPPPTSRRRNTNKSNDPFSL